MKYFKQILFRKIVTWCVMILFCMIQHLDHFEGPLCCIELHPRLILIH